MTVELIGMIGVHREPGASGASVHVIGGGVAPRSTIFPVARRHTAVASKETL